MKTRLISPATHIHVLGNPQIISSMDGAGGGGRGVDIKWNGPS